jgi:penicillin-binding protein 1A
MRVAPGSTGPAILEAFKPGTAPPDSSIAVIGGPDSNVPAGISPDVDRALRGGTGGLY